MSPTIYIAIILVVVLGIIILRLEEGDWGFNSSDVFGRIAAGAFIGFVIGIAFWVGIGMKNDPPRINYEEPQRNLVVLKDGMNISGSFFLGCGSFDGSLKYYGYEDLGDSRYKMVKFSNKSIVVEDIKEGESSYFIEIRKHSDPNDQAWEDKKWMMGPFIYDRHEGWEIHIPKGSIMKDVYNLDLE